MIEVRMADQENFHIVEMKAKFFDAGLNLWDRTLEIAVDQNVSLRRGDQKSRESFAAEVVDVSGHLVRRKGVRPLGGVLCHQCSGSEKHEHVQRKRQRQHFATSIHFGTLSTEPVCCLFDFTLKPITCTKPWRQGSCIAATSRGTVSV